MDSVPALERVNCDLCASADAAPLYAGDAWRFHAPEGTALVRCANCGLMYLSPRPTRDAIAAYYPEDYAPFRPAIEDEPLALMRWMRRRKLAYRRRLVERYAGQRAGRILDVGCATGLFLREMSLAGWETAGVELAGPAADYARRRFGLDVFTGMLEDAPFADGSFDAVTFWDVLEHTFSPSQTLARTAALLRPGGVAAINVPNWHSFDRRLFGAHWIGLDPPRHLFVFTRPTLTRLLEAHGLAPAAWQCVMPSYFSFAISLERALQPARPALARQVGRLLNLPGMRLPFEPWFTTANWLKRGGVISVFAVKQ